jgi:hypothetical protein
LWRHGFNVRLTLGQSGLFPPREGFAAGHKVVSHGARAALRGRRCGRPMIRKAEWINLLGALANWQGCCRYDLAPPSSP